MQLSDIRILDLSRMLAGPYCTALLADLGAEVIKIEAPGHGDDSRHIGPFHNNESVYSAILNRGKKSVTLNLKDPQAHRALLGLVGCSDVLVENFRPGTCARLGIDYATLHEINPRLIYASISGFGQEGPLSRRPAYDLIVQAASGLMSITGSPDGPPTRVGESVGDTVAGLFGAWAICAALVQRNNTGEGEHLDIAMLDSLLALQVTAMSMFSASGVPPGRVGNRHPVSTPFDTFQASDGLVVLAVANEPMFARLATMIGRVELVDDIRFASDEQRTRNEPELKEIIESWTRGLQVAEVVERASDAGVPAGPIQDLAEAIDSEQIRSRGLLVDLQHPVAGRLRFAGQPVRFSTGTPATTFSPTLGEHTDAVLRDLVGLSSEQVQALRDRGAT